MPDPKEVANPLPEGARTSPFHRHERTNTCNCVACRAPCIAQRWLSEAAPRLRRPRLVERLLAVGILCLTALSGGISFAAAPAHTVHAVRARMIPSATRPLVADDTHSLRAKIEDWLSASPNWKGPGKGTVDRFLASLENAYRAGPDLHFWELCLRAHGLPKQFPGHSELLRVADAADRIIRQDVRGEKKRGDRVSGGRRFSPWALTRVLAAHPAAGRRRAGSGRRDFVPTLEDRRAALSYLEQERLPSLRVALLAVGRRADDPLRPDVLGALGRWSRTVGPDAAVDLFLVQLLGTSFDRSAHPHPYNIVLDRLSPGAEPLAERARRLLSGRVGAMLLSADWREGARAIRLSTGFPARERVPMLLDALTVWEQRVNAGQDLDGVMRIQGDLVRALREISGRSHGKQPGPWIRWWVQVRQGMLPMPGTPEFGAQRRDREAEPRSTASFFGLRPETDRVTFVIDHSGSMNTGFATSDDSRYVEAVEQMMRFLQGAPEGTLFSTILFSDKPTSSGETLDPATPKMLDLARRDLLGRKPRGGTNLRPAIIQALALDARGFPRTEILKADTIIVLCDGMTSGGKSWVQPMLNKVLPIHPVVFHCVHLGPTSDGVLEALAKGSGGSYLRVGR